MKILSIALAVPITLSVWFFLPLFQTEYACIEHETLSDGSRTVDMFGCPDRKIERFHDQAALVDGKPALYWIPPAKVKEARIVGQYLPSPTPKFVEEHRHVAWLNPAVDIRALHSLIVRGTRFNNYASDGRLIFFENRQIEGADIASFEPLPNSIQGWHAWSRDRSRVYYETYAVPGAVPSDIQFSDPEHSMIVSNGRYFQTVPLPGAGERPVIERTDLGRHGRVLNAAYSIDRHRVLFTGEPIAGADAATFTALEPVCPVSGQPNLRCVATSAGDALMNGDDLTKLAWFGKDANHVYLNGKVMNGDGRSPEADPASFKLVRLPTSINSGTFVIGVDRNHLFKTPNESWNEYNASARKLKGDLIGPLFNIGTTPVLADGDELFQMSDIGDVLQLRCSDKQPQEEYWQPAGKFRAHRGEPSHREFKVAIENDHYVFYFVEPSGLSPDYLGWVVEKSSGRELSICGTSPSAAGA